MVFNRFLARRGKPTTIISDNGTNFVGFARELKEYLNSWNQDQITSGLAQKHIAWKFNPPGAPFLEVFGSLGAAGQKLQESNDGNSRESIFDESLTTTMCLVEQTLNARPFTSASDDPSDIDALTPNHFILERANVCILFMPNAEVYSNHRKMFRLCQAYADMIWKRWVAEYPPQNNVRTQWSKHKANVEAGDLVWLVDNNVKMSQYKMARFSKRWCSEISAYQN